jgi:hypothetical protein
MRGAVVSGTCCQSINCSPASSCSTQQHLVNHSLDDPAVFRSVEGPANTLKLDVARIYRSTSSEAIQDESIQLYPKPGDKMRFDLEMPRCESRNVAALHGPSFGVVLVGSQPKLVQPKRIINNR